MTRGRRSGTYVTCDRCGALISSRQIRRHRNGKPCHIRRSLMLVAKAGYERVEPKWITPLKTAIDKRYWVVAPRRLFNGRMIYTTFFKSPRSDVSIAVIMKAAYRLAHRKGIPVYRAIKYVLVMSSPRIRALSIPIELVGHEPERDAIAIIRDIRFSG